MSSRKFVKMRKSAIRKMKTLTEDVLKGKGDNPL